MLPLLLDPEVETSNSFYCDAIFWLILLANDNQNDLYICTGWIVANEDASPVLIYGDNNSEVFPELSFNKIRWELNP